ncbi:MAG: betaine--homocysteine S-methyltransferase [Cucumibacter sp.]
MDALTILLGEGRTLIADGALGTNLIPLGLDSGQAPESWNLERPDVIRDLHKSFIDAGADILVTNSFGGTSRRLHLHALHHRVIEINALAAGIAREAAANAGRPIVIAGSVGPTGDLFTPLGALTYAEAVDAFAEQIEGLKRGGADLAWIETMSAPEEIDAAIEAAVRVGLPYAVTASFDTAGHTMMGLSPAAFGQTMQKRAALPVAFGSNCGVGAADLLVALLALTENAGPLPVIAKANAGVPHIHRDAVVYTGTPDLMADYARLAVDIGARIVGGCCGSTPEHVRRMHVAIAGYQPRARPSVAEITARLGPLVSPAAASAGDRPARRRRRA